MRKIITLICCAVLSGTATGCAAKAEPVRLPENTVQTSGFTYTCSFDGIQYEYTLDLPEQTDDAPLILMLHGYGDTAQGFRTSSHLQKEANAAGYAVAYAGGGLGWNCGLEAEGNPDTDFLVGLAHDLQAKYGLDAKRTYAVGFSNGACMVHRLAMEAGDTFSACVSVEGMMPERIWNARGAQKAVSFFQITGEKDTVVPKHSDGTADHTPAPAIEDVLAYFAEAGGLTQTAQSEIGNGSTLKKYTKPGSSAQVWELLIAGGGHTWQSRSSGIDTNTLILEFLETQA